MSSFRRSRFLAAVLAAGTTTSLVLAEGQAHAQAFRRGETAPRPSASQQSPRADAGPLQLNVRRFPDAVELVIEGAGDSPQLQQSTTPSGWQGRLLLAAPSGLRSGPQRLSFPELGFQSVSLAGSGTSYLLQVDAAPGMTLGRPVVSSDGRDLILTFASPVPQARLQVNRPNLTQPGAVPLPTYAPPLQPRAVAPPLGDMAVGSMIMRNPGYVNVSGPPVTLTLRNAPARDALMALASLGGYGFVWVDQSTPQTTATRFSATGGTSTLTEATIPGKDVKNVSAVFRSENYSTAFNAILLGSGAQGRKEGNTIFAGLGVLNAGLGPQVTKIYRLNQVGPNAAADYLANLGARISKTDTIITSVTAGVSGEAQVAGGLASQTTQTQSEPTVREFGASRGPLVGLSATTDTRLGTITMFGSPDIVAIGEQYLKQLDLRQRQVALSLKILDVDLGNDSEIDNSFAIRWGDTFIVNDRGSLLGAFGRALPPTFRPALGEVNPGLGFSNPAANPGLAYPENEFFNFLRAQIVSRNTKLLASPTLILQENASLLRGGTAESAIREVEDDVRQGIRDIGIDSPIGRRRANEGVVRVGTNVVTNYETDETQGVITCTPELSTAGLVLGARVEKIDDNGFVTFTLSPSVSAVVEQQPAPEGCGAPLNILSIRSLDTGALRVRDGQTLILTGVISDFTRSEVSKWPILGDIPLIGQFFRATTNQREKRELVIMVSPRIINDDDGGMFGYGFQPSSNSVRELLGQP